MKGGTDKIKTSVEATGISDKTSSLAVHSVLELGKKLRKTNTSGSESEIQAQLKDLFKQRHGSDDDRPAATNPLLNMLGALI